MTEPMYPAPFRDEPFDEQSPLAKWFLRHLSAMTAERLHDKSDIAWQLAARDVEIEKLAAEVERLRVIEISNFLLESKVVELNAEVERLRVLGPDTEARITVEARRIASQMMQPCVQSWREANEELKSEVERLRAIVAKLPTTADGVPIV